MNGNCDIIRDLLPLYRDDVCSPASKALVDAHLKECPECRQALEQIEMEVQAPEPAMEEAFRAWQKLRRRILIKRLMKMAAVALALVIAVAGGMVVRDRYDFGEHPLDVDGVEITALYRLSDGGIYMAMQGIAHNLATVTCGPEMPQAHETEGSGTYFFELNWTRYDDRSLYYSRNEFDFVIPAVDTWRVEDVEYTFVTEQIEIICGDERRMICEFDDVLPAAPPEIEFRADQLTNPING